MIDNEKQLIAHKSCYKISAIDALYGCAITPVYKPIFEQITVIEVETRKYRKDKITVTDETVMHFEQN